MQVLIERRDLESNGRGYDDDFFDDMLGVFPTANGYAPKEGLCGKYMYDAHNWSEFIEQSASYYPPEGDKALMEAALRDLNNWGIPTGTPYLDLGVGGSASFRRYALPTIRQLRSEVYIGVDYCEAFLGELSALQSEVGEETTIRTEKMDFFVPTNKVISSSGPALGVMNGLTLGNMGGSIRERESGANLVKTLRYLSQLCGHGWLLVTIDTNQSESHLRRAYVNPLNGRLCLSILSRMATELPVEGFNPRGFRYDVEFHGGPQLLAHLAVATEEQEFTLGPYHIRVEDGQRIHLLNSYKWNRDVFERSCGEAGLTPVRFWKHETGMMLYLLRDALCPVPQVQPRRKDIVQQSTQAKSEPR